MWEGLISTWVSACLVWALFKIDFLRTKLDICGNPSLKSHHVPSYLYVMFSEFPNSGLLTINLSDLAQNSVSITCQAVFLNFLTVINASLL